MITVKSVKNINLTVKKDSINISAPPQVTRRELKAALEHWRPKIEEELASFKRENLESEQFLMYLNDKGVYYIFSPDIENYKWKVRDDSILIEIPASLAETFDPEDFKKFIHKKFGTIKKVEEGVLDSVLLYGKRLQVVFSNQSNCIFHTDKKLIMPSKYKTAEEQIEALDEYMTAELVSCIEEDLKKWEPVIKRSVESIQIKKYKSKWGSLKPREGNLRVNFYLVCTDRKCIEAIILHELCHFKHHGHQKDFYNHLLHFMPDYHEWDKKLNECSLPLDYYTLV